LRPHQGASNPPCARLRRSVHGQTQLNCPARGGRYSAALLKLSGIYRAGLGEDGPGMGAVVLGGFVDRIAETITRAGTATG
jgi:hypothetical protein